MPTMVIDSVSINALPPLLARGPPPAPGLRSGIQNSVEFSKSPGWGGARANSGGARAGAGRPRKIVAHAMPIDGFRWFVARATFGMTDVAESDIWAAGHEIFAPQLYRPAMPARRNVVGTFIHARAEQFLPLFVRYVIVKLDLSDPSWRSIPYFDSVERIISGGHVGNGGLGVPIAIADAEVEKVRRILSPDGCLYPGGYRAAPNGRYYPASYFKGDRIEIGASVRVPDGPAPDAEGICEMSDGQRVVLLMTWFGRDNVRTTVAQAGVSLA